MRPFYKIIDHTADIGIEVTATSANQLFEKSAVTFCDLICKFTTIKSTVVKRLIITASNYEQLLQKFLSELLFLFDSEHILFSNIKIETLSQKGKQRPVDVGKLCDSTMTFAENITRRAGLAPRPPSKRNAFIHTLPRGVFGKKPNKDKLVVLVAGEKIDPKRHKIKMGIKAVTHHQLKIFQQGKNWKARVIFDI